MALLVGGCAADAATAPERVPAYASAVAMTPLDVAGAWQWTRTDRLTFPPFAAAVIFGVEPEGQRTVATCHTEGTIAFSQAGTSFSGTELTSASNCRTLGGQSFAVESAADVSGELVGAVSVALTFEGMVPCLLHGVARDISGGVASRLEGSGRCIIPGHPQSGVPGFDPPPLGTEVITSWSAVRD
jgi:hypothetical protein